MSKQKKKNLPKAVIYARFSSYGQNEQSIEGQLKDCHAFAEREGIQVVGEYIDRAKSARSADRPDFQRMIKDAEKRQFQYVIVWKVDRFSRNRYDSAIYKSRLKKFGVKVLSVMENITDSPEGIILEGMLESLAEYYSASLSENVKRGQRESIAKGRFTGGVVPYGYKSENGRLVENERTAPIIRSVFKQYAEGVPMKKIIDNLREKGIKSPSGGQLRYSSFEVALKNPVYIGKLMRKGQEVVGCADPLIDEETFQRVQERRKTSARAPATAKAKIEYQLQGKAFCGICGANMVGESGTSRNGSKYYYYTCSARKRDKSCDKAAEKKGFIEWYVVEQTQEYVLSPERIDYIAQAVVNEYKKDFNVKAVDEMERAIRRADADLNTLVDTLLDTPKAARHRIYERMELLEAQKQEMESDLAKLKVAVGIAYTEEEVKAWLTQFCKGDPLDLDFRIRIIDVFINSVYLYDDTIVIFYNIKNGQQVSYVGLCESLDDPGSDLTFNGGA
ncbi:MAG TPA: recombinase family protein [Christensenellaceae bacterium]|jgi:site-specific DNA recombinase|nr:recombinase family protein [Christensenellaceae bacterium]